MKTVGLFFGGLSNEAEVSVISAKNIAKNIDKNKYKLVLIYWAKNGRFYHVKNFDEITKISKAGIPLEKVAEKIDVAFPITHGKYGEDGCLQGLFEIFKIKYCGCRVLSSSLCMDKAEFKNYLVSKKFPQVKFINFDSAALERKDVRRVIARTKKYLKLPVYVKPANSGSSVGITKIEKWSELQSAIRAASKHDNKIVLEEGLNRPKEIEVAVLGNGEFIISLPGELQLVNDFYDYDDKYKKGEAGQIIPARIPSSTSTKIRKMAAEAYKMCGCRGFARVDFFLHRGKIYLNEINTLPGFTDISMYPMLMKAMGLNYKNMISKIIELAY